MGRDDVRTFSFYSPMRAWIVVQVDAFALATLGFIGFVVLVALLLRMFRAPPWLFIATVFAAALAFVLNVYWPGRAVVTEDGVVLRRGGHRTFISFAELARVEPIHRVILQPNVVATAPPAPPVFVDGIRFVWRERHELDLIVSAGARENSAVDRMAEAIREARCLAQYQPPPEAAFLARNGCSAREWVLNLTRLGTIGAHGYRETNVPHEVLWQVLESPAADHAVRAGAAIALRASLDKEGLARVRVAASRCGEPHLRLALESVGQGDDEETIERAMASFD